MTDVPGACNVGSGNPTVVPNGKLPGDRARVLLGLRRRARPGKPGSWAREGQGQQEPVEHLLPSAQGCVSAFER